MLARLTPEQARRVELPWNPITRIRQLGEHATKFGMKQVGFSPLPMVMTRRGLVRLAEASERAEHMGNMLSEIEARGDEPAPPPEPIPYPFPEQVIE